MTEISVTPLASSIFKSCAFKVRDQLTNLTWHGFLVAAGVGEIKQ